MMITTNSFPFRSLSWGCGVQSTCLAVMSALGEIEPLDAIITADTMWERQKTYKIRDFYTEWLEARGVRVEIVSAGDIRQLGAANHMHIPFWTDIGGPLRRQCTRHFKIRPIKHRIREMLGLHASDPPHPKANAVELWLGISWDEFSRMNSSRVAFISHRWPLIEKRLTRNDCEDYLQALGLPIPVKSACVGCPYRQPSEWIELKTDDADEWQQAVEFDERNRDNPLAKRKGGGSKADQLYIYKYGKPLANARLEADARREKRGKQLPLFCESGYCWT